MSSLRRLAHCLWDAYNRFFFEAVDVRICAMLRIGYASLLLVNAFVWLGFAELWFGERGVMPYELSLTYRPTGAWSLLDAFPQSDLWMRIVLSLLMLALVLLLLGAFSRVQAAIVYVLLVSLQHRNDVILDGEDIVFRLFGFFIIFLPLGATWSLDAVRRGPPSKLYPRWPLRCIQIELCLVFFAAGAYKAIGEPWQDGTALYYISRLDDFFGRFWAPAFLFNSLPLLKAATWSVVALEIVLPIAVWFRKTRLPTVVAAVCFHLAIDYVMNLFLFQWIMLLGWLTFLEAQDLDWLVARCRGRPRGAAPGDKGETTEDGS